MNEPSCPFCGGLLDRPRETASSEMPVGTCSCGAVYACDVTGHNLGTALVEALVQACDGDSNRAWNLLPDEDYVERQFTNYDYETHMIIHGGVYRGRRIAGTLLFIRLTRGTCVAEGRESAKISSGEASVQSAEGQRRGRTFSKKDVETLVRAYDLEPLFAVAEQEKRIMRDLKRLLYTPDLLLRWRAAEALGRVSAIIARTDPGFVSQFLQGLFSSVKDTASSSWGAVDAIGEIVRFQSDRFSGFIPQLALLLPGPSLAEEVLRALGKIADEKSELLREASYHVIRFLENSAPAVRGYAAILLGRMKVREAREKLERLRMDQAEIDVYRDGMLEKKSVGRLAEEALERL